jgi:uncharacterized protein (DUF2249 family)
MVIRKQDRVSSVLAADESLVEVFVGVSPAFERLRNPALRKVMSRLVTVEQAARVAGVDADDLVARLNAGPCGGGTAGCGPSAGPARSGRAGEAAGDRPTRLATIPPESVVELDVREDLRQGREPFSRIMAARRQLPAGGALLLRAIFEPVPLYGVMEKHGLAHHTEQLGPDDWCVWFFALESSDQPVAGTGGTEDGGGSAALEEGVVVLDVRGLEPPEPMVRTLAALEALPPDATLVQVNVRVPRFLLPQLEERGFVYEVREQEPDVVRLFIRRAP